MKVLHEDDYFIIVPSNFVSSHVIDAMNTEIPRALFHISNHKLLHMYVPTDLRNRGIGKKMLFAVAKECVKNGCERIDLDDFSNNFRLNEKNVYIQCGFAYNTPSGPEMFANPHYILKKLEKFMEI